MVNKGVNKRKRYLLHQGLDKGDPQKGRHPEHWPRVGQDEYKPQDLQYEGRCCNQQHEEWGQIDDESESCYEWEAW